MFLPHQWRPGWITRVAFVAPKMDLVHPADRDRMLMLLRRMAERYAADRDGLKYEFFNLSSVVSTKALPADDGPRVLVGTPLRGTRTGGRCRRGRSSGSRRASCRTTGRWSGRPGRYAFPEVYPRMPARKDYPPDQVNVDQLASFVIE